MHIVVGVDETEQTKRTLDVVASLRFSKPQLDLVNVIEQLGVGELGWTEGAAISGDAVQRYVAYREAQAKESLRLAREEATGRGLECKEHRAIGFISNELVQFADKAGADLLALGSSEKSRLEGILIGSVGRKAVISSKRSVLICRKPAPAGRPLNVVLATDHSAYANKCMELLTRFAPSGIGRMVVTTVYPEQLVRSVSVVVEHFKADVGGWVEDELKRCNSRLIDTLRPLGCEFVSRVEKDNVNDSITRVMKEEKADLLVLGAQGHGFVDRMMIGSISLHQAVTQPASVMILRA